MLKYNSALKIKMLLTMMLLMTLLMYYYMNKYTLYMSKKMFLLSTMDSSYNLTMDQMTMIFLMTVFMVSMNVFYYSMYYMEKEFFYKRFFMLLLSFVSTMILFILSKNIFFMLLGWDGLGITSYLLVSYYQNIKSTNSATMTILINRMGDVALIFCITLVTPSQMYLNCQNISYTAMSLMVLAAMVKSAQFPFSVWLPAAMAAPTPVSSLVHSSTLVTAGVFMLIRYNNLLTNKFMMIYLSIGIVTTFFSSYSNYGEFNMKKIVALSTMSQLGMMFIFMGFNMTMMAFFHLIIHAFFKSTMFMLAGIFLHSSFGNLDIRYLNSNYMSYPFVLSTFTIGNLCLMGMPLFSGFFSKDLSIELSMSYNKSMIIMSMLLISILMTMFYSIKLMTMMSGFTKNSLVVNNFNYMKLSMMMTLMPAVIYMLLSGYLFLVQIFDSTSMLPIMFMNKMSPTVTMSMGYFMLMTFWLKKKKYMFNHTYNTYFMNAVFTNMSKNFYFLKNAILLMDKNVLDKMIGHYAYMNMNNTLIYTKKMYNNYMKSMIFMLMFLLMVI